MAAWLRARGRPDAAAGDRCGTNSWPMPWEEKSAAIRGQYGTVSIHLDERARRSAIRGPSCHNPRPDQPRTSVLRLPPEAVGLAANVHDPHHAFLVGKCAGSQFHPEFDLEPFSLTSASMPDSCVIAASIRSGSRRWLRGAARRVDSIAICRYGGVRLACPYDIPAFWLRAPSLLTERSRSDILRYPDRSANDDVKALVGRLLAVFEVSYVWVSRCP